MCSLIGTNFCLGRRQKRDASLEVNCNLPTIAGFLSIVLRPARILAVLIMLSMSANGAYAAAKATPPARPRPASTRRQIAAIGMTHGPLIADMEDARACIDKMVKAAQALNEYRFTSEMTVYKQNKNVVETSDFYFKKIRQIRVEITGGPKKGAVAVLRGDGKVRAHLGGALKFFVVTLDPHSNQLDSANDYPMVDSDFLSLAQFLENWVKEGIRSRVSKESMQQPGSDKLAYVVEMYKDNDENRILKRIFVDANSYLPLEWYDYRDGTLWSKSVFTNLLINPGLNDSLFDIK